VRRAAPALRAQRLGSSCPSTSLSVCHALPRACAALRSRSYGGCIHSAWDQRALAAQLDAVLHPKLLEGSRDFELAPGLHGFARGSFADAHAHVDAALVGAESASLLGFAAFAEFDALVTQAHDLLAAIVSLSGGDGAPAPAARSPRLAALVSEFKSQLPAARAIAEVRARVVDRAAPFTVLLLQELERHNGVVRFLARELAELVPCALGELAISSASDESLSTLGAGAVPLSWLLACGQAGPSGAHTRQGCAVWFKALLRRDKQLDDWAQDPMELPVSAWRACAGMARCARASSRSRAMPSVFACRRLVSQPPLR
jgi:hypothetical protein